jgi:hypothetical protein
MSGYETDYLLLEMWKQLTYENRCLALRNSWRKLSEAARFSETQRFLIWEMIDSGRMDLADLASGMRQAHRLSPKQWPREKLRYRRLLRDCADSPRLRKLIRLLLRAGETMVVARG